MGREVRYSLPPSRLSEIAVDNAFCQANNRQTNQPACLLQIFRVGLLERGYSRMNVRVDFKEGFETDCVEYVLDLFAGVK